MAEPRHLDLVDRLRGQYHLPVNDGAGPLNGSMTFSREFPTPPIQKEAADEIERLRAALESLTKDPPATLDEPDTDAEVIIKMRAIARAALNIHNCGDKE